MSINLGPGNQLHSRILWFLPNDASNTIGNLPSVNKNIIKYVILINFLSGIQLQHKTLASGTSQLINLSLSKSFWQNLNSNNFLYRKQRSIDLEYFFFFAWTLMLKKISSSSWLRVKNKNKNKLINNKDRVYFACE